MITNEQVVAQMKRTMSEIEASTGEARKLQVAKLMGFCELLLADNTSAPASSTPSVSTETSSNIRRMQAEFLGIPLDDEESNEGGSLLDF